MHAADSRGGARRRRWRNRTRRAGHNFFTDARPDCATCYIAASTETDEDDAEVEDGCEGPAGAWDAELGASGSGSDGDDGLEFLG